MVWTVRAVRLDDLDSLLELVQSATKGLTSLQLDRRQLHDRIEQSVFAFSRTAKSPKAEPYVLVMANDADGQIIGTSTVYAKTGGHQPFYAYRRVVSEHHCEALGVRNQRERLELYRTHDGPSEIGSLFLRGKFRGEGRGRWLSLARFMLIAMRPERFADEVIAEMRGWADVDGQVPFWESVTGRFIPVPFATADAMSTVSKQFIEDMMPQFPIYLDLLPETVRHKIGHVHHETEPAMAMLDREGFEPTDLVDIFDAGPVISCPTHRIAAVNRCRTFQLERVMDVLPESSTHTVVASQKDGFTSVRAQVLESEHSPKQGIVSTQTARALGIEPGQPFMAMADQG